MLLFRRIDELPPEFRRGALTIGNFDGVHRGHARIVERLLAEAAAVGGKSLAFTFDPHPVALLRPGQSPPPLTTTDRKAELLGELGVEGMVAYPTDRRLLGLSPREFFEEIIVGQIGAKRMVEGPDFRFGNQRAGTINELRSFCDAQQMTLEIVPPLLDGATSVSSSRIRERVSLGDVAEAARLLGRPHRIAGDVETGAKRGRTIGFPTANLAKIDTLLPCPGVYAGRAIHRGGTSPAAINIGPNPTFGEQGLKVEVHLIDFTGDLYGQQLSVDFLARIRDVKKFGGVGELVEQLKRDVEEAKLASTS